MKLHKSLLSLTTLVLGSLSAYAGEMTAPPFSAMASDGKHYNVQSLTSGQPVLMMFFSAGCPHNAHGIEDMNRLTKLAAGKIRIVGMTNLDAKQTKQFARNHHAKFPILSDSDGKVIAKFGALAGLDNVLILPNGKLAKKWTGYNQTTVGDVEAELSRRGYPALKLNVAHLPKDRQSGCAFGEDMR